MLSDEEKKAIEWIKCQKGIYYKTIVDLIEKQDKIINEMAEIIEECRQNDCLDVSNLDFGEIAGTEKIIKYFEKKVGK